MITDGGLATTLQARGLPPFTPVDGWLLERPDEVARAHRAFADAGAACVLTGTFRTLPSLGPDWERVADRAVEAAAAAGVDVWGSIGPASTPARRWRPGEDPGWGALAARLAPHVRGLVLETFVDPEEALAALGAARDLAPTVALLTVRGDGHLFGGAPAGPALRRLLAAGAVAVGVGCGGPEGARRALERWDGPPPWVRPGCDGDEAAWLSVAVELAPRAAAIGGCCGVSPALLGALARRLGAPRA